MCEKRYVRSEKGGRGGSQPDILVSAGKSKNPRLTSHLFFTVMSLIYGALPLFACNFLNDHFSYGKECLKPETVRTLCLGAFHC